MVWGLSTGRRADLVRGLPRWAARRPGSPRSSPSRSRWSMPDRPALRLLRLDRRRHGGRSPTTRRGSATCCMSTPLRPAEYVVGQVPGGRSPASSPSLGLHVLLAVFFNHVVPNAGGGGDPRAASRWSTTCGRRWSSACRRSSSISGSPSASASAGGGRSRSSSSRSRVLIACGFFLWSWAPTWLDPRINRLLMLVDPAGFRWLNETWIKLDRGAGLLQHAPASGSTRRSCSRAWPSWRWGSAAVGARPAASRRQSPGRDAGRRAAPRRPEALRRAEAAAAWRPPLRVRSRTCGCASRPVGLAAGDLEVAPHGAAQPPRLARPLSLRRPHPAADAGRQPARPGAVPDPVADHAGHRRGAGDEQARRCSSACS